MDDGPASWFWLVKVMARGRISRERKALPGHPVLDELSLTVLLGEPVKLSSALRRSLHASSWLGSASAFWKLSTTFWYRALASPSICLPALPPRNGSA